MDDAIYRAPAADSPTTHEHHALAEVVRFWEKGRLRYNLVLLPFGMIALLTWVLSDLPTSSYLVVSVLLFAVGANGCYLLGPLAEIYGRVFLAKSAETPHLRRVLYWGGILFSMIVILSFALLFLFAGQFGAISQS